MVIGLAFAAALAVATFVPLLQTGDTVPPVPLVDQRGAAFSVAALRGNAVILSFVYTRCADPAMCPLVSSKFARLQTLIGNAPVHLVEITLDPSYDSPRVLGAYGRAFGANPARWTLATGAQASIDDLAGRLGIATQWTRPGTLVHTESVVVLDREARVVRIVDGNTWAPADVLAIASAAAFDAPPLATRIRLWLGAAVEACGGGSIGVSAYAVLGLLFVTIGACCVLLLRALRISQ